MKILLNQENPDEQGLEKIVESIATNGMITINEAIARFPFIGIKHG